ncbi:hypothetical protein BDN72DRAFT_899665 [Pluteus cervinus]|uniref:Uncharacterized protein n=1 Tax=Pluteus cervinus TaxID=181527 RepID=A0ACD3AM92_9AGAR|nr:hypothetical protein BDN72DRAFT_899665 [Pluteus cervinus]
MITLRDLLRSSPPPLNKQGLTAPMHHPQPPIANIRLPDRLTLRQVVAYPYLHEKLDALVDTISTGIDGSILTSPLPCNFSDTNRDNEMLPAPDYHSKVSESCLKGASALLRAHPEFQESSATPDLPLAWKFRAEPALGVPDCGVGVLDHVATRQPLVVWAFHPTPPPDVVSEIVRIPSKSINGYAWRRPNPTTSGESGNQDGAASFLERTPDYITKDVISTIFPSWWIHIDLSVRDPSALLPDIVPESSEDEQACSTIQRAWLLATLHDATFIVLSDGTSERIGIRHRASQTLFLSGPIKIAHRINYFKSQIGLYLAAYYDSFKRFRPLPPVDDSPESALSLSVHLPIQFCGAPPEIWIKDDGHLDLLKGFKHIPFSPGHTTMLQGPHLKLRPTMTSYLPFQGALYSGEMHVQDKLCVASSSGVLPCKILCHEFAKYQALMREGPFRPTQILQYYSLLRRNGTDATMALILDNPGTALDAYKGHLTLRQVDSFLKQLRQIHLAGFLHGHLISENLYVGEDNVSAFIIGFSNACEVDLSTENGRARCGWEVEQLANTLWSKHDCTHELLNRIIENADYDNWDWGTYSQWRETLVATGNQMTDHPPRAVVALV